ncbi:hypothetical protein [Cesiribacter sp. SM1]|uniref:hypothetical protein n=1 Tax=Cesiribacter sp. SM1 TaxID=2861196 RepID=UPI001CD19FCA|nr:hypothetical protein [Cesiribacter sp. SM1]
MHITKIMSRAACVLLLVSLFSFAPAAVFSSVFEQLGLSREEAQEDIVSSFMGGSLYNRNMSAARSIPVSARAAVVQQIALFAKEVVNTPAFIEAYQQERENNKPLESDFFPENGELYPAEEQAEMRKYFKMAVQEWEQQYPQDHRLFLKQRLREFLAVTADVDFAAALEKHPYMNKMVFVNQEYESKPEEWKKAFRAGNEATAAARQFAGQWLKELP